MEKEVIKIAAKFAALVYKENFDADGVEFLPSLHYSDTGAYQILAIAGTNEATDWIGNLNLTSWKGIKTAAYVAARKIRRVYTDDVGTPLIVTGHSAGAATAIAFTRLFGADYCVGFCPARALRYWVDRKMENTVIVVDPDDPVPKMGFLSFGHPICERIVLPDDNRGMKVKDHFMAHIENFVEAL